MAGSFVGVRLSIFPSGKLDLWDVQDAWFVAEIQYGSSVSIKYWGSLQFLKTRSTIL